MVFHSQSPAVNVPSDVSLWTWLFDSDYSCLRKVSGYNIQGFTDASTRRSISFEETKRYTTYVATSLRLYHGLREGDVVMVYSRNSIWYPVATLSAVRIGAIACGVSPDYNIEELVYSLRLTRAKFIMTTSEHLNTALAAAAKTGLKTENVILMDGSRSDCSTTTLENLIETGASRGANEQSGPYLIPKGKTNKDVCSYLCLSSGTTGLPKAVMISHANIMAQCLQIQQITPRDHDKILAALPFYHITGIVHQLHLPIVLNAHVYVVPKFTMEALLQTASDYKIKELLIVPPILIRLVREDFSAKFDLSHVTRFSSGAAPLAREVLDELESKFPGTGFKQGYGMTESCSAITSHPPSKYAYKYADKVGMVVASTEVRIIDPETEADCGVGKAGEIWVRGPQVAMGYWENPKATADTFARDGFLHTGDIGYFDNEGLLSITDRIKEMIKVKGIAVAPAELESALLGHPDVADVAVCGISDDRAGERPKAFVVLKPVIAHPETAAKALLQYVKREKARYKWLAEVELVKTIPKSAAGKILRRKLKGNSSASRGNVIVRDEAMVANFRL